MQIFFMLLLHLLLPIKADINENTLEFDRPANMPNIRELEVMCGKDHMNIKLEFDKPFNGVVFSENSAKTPKCTHVHAQSRRTSYHFKIFYNECGTKPDLNGKYYENTIIVQYDPELLEVWDDAKRLRCQWFNAYEKTATKPPMLISDLDVIEMEFIGDNVECWMEIQEGKGPWAPPLSKIAALGSILSLVIGINDATNEFDMRVKSCRASNGRDISIPISDEFGCVQRRKMFSNFMKVRSNDEVTSLITYAHFHAFKFPDAISVHISCKVEICRRGCPEHCQREHAGFDRPEGKRNFQSPGPSANDEFRDNFHLNGISPLNTNISFDAIKLNSVRSAGPLSPAHQSRFGVVGSGKEIGTVQMSSRFESPREGQYPPSSFYADESAINETLANHVTNLFLSQKNMLNRGDRNRYSASEEVKPKNHNSSLHGIPKAERLTMDSKEFPESAQFASEKDLHEERIHSENSGEHEKMKRFPWGPRSLRRRKRFSTSGDGSVNTSISIEANFHVISQSDLDMNSVSSIHHVSEEQLDSGEVCMPVVIVVAAFLFVTVMIFLLIVLIGYMYYKRLLVEDKAKAELAMNSFTWRNWFQNNSLLFQKR